MGTSGNRRGYKVFSINTTVRNPKRNIEFLKYFEKFNGLVFDERVKTLYLMELVRNGVYQFSNISDSIRQKIINDIALNDEEIKEAFVNNPQATGFAGRTMTQLRALKDQAFLIFSGHKNKPTITMTKLAFELINRQNYITDIYSKIMIGLHSSNPARTTMFNQARVFLNTLFVIDLLKKEWQNLGNESKGILKHEFKSFVLGMKDCDYKQCVKNILAYRSIHGLKENSKYIQHFLFKQEGLESVSYSTLNDYADEVFRKFEMTGLLIARGQSQFIYYDFSSFNIKKVESILNAFKNYQFERFSSVEAYINFIDNIRLPWIENQSVRKAVILQKAKAINKTIRQDDFVNLDELENALNQEFYHQSLQKAILESDINELLRELKILALPTNETSRYDDLPEPLRLEYLLALILGKKYGVETLNSNLIYNENGEPLSYAPAGKADLKYRDFLLEATMIKNRNQQLNSETTSIIRHMQESIDKEQRPLRTMLIAPLIHFDVALFFKFCAKEFESKIAPLSIKNFIQLIESSPDFNAFERNFDSFVDKLLEKKTKDYIDCINPHTARI